MNSAAAGAFQITGERPLSVIGNLHDMTVRALPGRWFEHYDHSSFDYSPGFMAKDAFDPAVRSDEFKA
jgi:hypothetical protein